MLFTVKAAALAALSATGAAGTSVRNLQGMITSPCNPEAPPPLDGECHNVRSPSWGAAGSTFRRLAPADYPDGKQEMRVDLPSARAISNAVFQQSPEDFVFDENHIKDLHVHFGQFFNHDCHQTGSDRELNEEAPISVPLNDPWLSKDINFVRGFFEVDEDGVRQPTNGQLSAFIDGSAVYGSSQEHHDRLRSYSKGHLEVIEVGGAKFPPFDDGETKLMVDAIPADHRPADWSGLILAGDDRANEQPGLLLFHIIFHREHNWHARRIAEQLPRDTPDEEVFQRARRMVVAEMQNIIAYEWLPALIGEGVLPPYSGYNEAVNPDPSVEMMVGALRMGHSQINDQFLRKDEHGSDCCGGPVRMVDGFFQPDLLTEEGGMEAFLRGMLHQPTQKVDTFVADSNRNLLFHRDFGLDLVAFNLQRSRDFGTPSYNKVRIALGLTPMASFADVSSDPHTVYRLTQAYESIEDVELFVGGLAEDHVTDSSLGETFQAIFVDHFKHLRDGDRLWFENEDEGVLTPEEMAEVKATNLRDIILRNTAIKPDELETGNVFRGAPFPEHNCASPKNDDHRGDSNPPPPPPNRDDSPPPPPNRDDRHQRPRGGK